MASQGMAGGVMADQTEPAVQTGESSVGALYVSARSMVLMSAYLVALCVGLSYCLVALWPSGPSLTIRSITPHRGKAMGGDKIAISGANFPEGVQVFFDGIQAKAVRESDTLITATTPGSNHRLVKVEVNASTGEKASITNGFLFETDKDSSQGGASTSSVASASATATPATSTASAGRGTDSATSSDPVNTEPDSPKSGQALFGWAIGLSSSVRLLLIVMVVGALGALIHVIHSFYWYVGNRNLKASWLLMYFFLPFIGAGLALLFFLIQRGLSTQPLTIQSSVDGYCALAALVGMFSQQAMTKLKKIAEGFFSTAERGKDPATPVDPNITAVNPKQGSALGPAAPAEKVTIAGTGLSSVTSVTFGGIAATNITIDHDTQISAYYPAHAAGSVDVVVTTGSGKKASLPGAFTYV